MSGDTSPEIKARMIEGIRRQQPWERIQAVERSQKLLAGLLEGREAAPHAEVVREERADRGNWTPEQPEGGLTRVVAALNGLGIRYAVGGSLASSLYGIHRFTNDIDILAEVRETDVEPLSAALGADFYSDVSAMLEAVHRGECFNILELSTMDKFDIFVASTPFSRLEITRSVETLLGPEPSAARVRFITAEDTILAKLSWHRQGGEASSRQLSDVVGVIQVQGDRLDGTYLNEWSDKLGVRDLLDRCLVEAAVDGLP